jgi:hypothetical protein
MFVAEHLISSIVDEYRKHPVSTGGDSWYPQACKFLKVDHHIHFLYTILRKTSLKEQCNIVRIEREASTITFLTKRISAD